jgi:ABC-type glycerol-3-phosphate transport system substrate-binding protein
MKKNFRIFLLALFVGGLLLSGCQKKEAVAVPEESGPVRLVVWSFTDELEKMINQYYKPAHPGVEIDYTLTPWGEFSAKIDPVLASGQGAPDLFALEDGFVRKYVESGLLLDLSDIYEANKDKLIQYQAEVGSYNGKVYGLSWQATPGGVYYRRSYAKKYLGSDDPDVVQTYFTDMNKFLETAQYIKDQSNGACYITIVDYLNEPYRQNRSQSWIVDGKLVVDSKMLELMDIAKSMQDKGFTPRGLRTGTEGEYAFMRDELKDAQGNLMEEFCVFLPSWGLQYVLKNNAPDTAGDWGIIPGPLPYRSGGTWAGAYKGVKNVAAVKEFIRYITTDDVFLESYARDYGEFVSNWNVIDKIKGGFSEAFLGGQNQYAFFAVAARDINGKLTQATDSTIRTAFEQATVAYINGEKSRDQAVADFKNQIESELGL